MKKLSAIFILLAFVFAGAAEAAPLGSASARTAVENVSPIERAQSNTPGNRCGPGFAWYCKGGVCKCRQTR